MHRDRIVGIITVIIGAAVALMTFQLPDSNMAGDVGPKVFPFISAAIMLLCGAILVVRKPTKDAKPFLVGEQKKRFLAIIAVIIGYIVLMWAVGFVIPTLLMLVVLCLMFGKDEKVPVWQAIVYAVIITGIIYVMFSIVLHLRLPVGNIINLI